MAAQKRTLDDSASSPKAKKSRTDKPGKSKNLPPASTTAGSSLLTEEVDFPRGGGTSFTPLEVKAIRAEAVKEANAELFEVHFLTTRSAHSLTPLQDANVAKKNKKGKRKAEAEASTSSRPSEGKDRIRIEHLNYKVSCIDRRVTLHHLIPFRSVSMSA